VNSHARRAYPDPAEQDGQIELAILASLLDRHGQRPWSVDEVAREIDNPVAV
jgi:hypothetical protein